MDLNNKVSEILHAFREIYVRDSKKFYKNEIFNLKLSWATAISKVYFFPSITKFTYEGIVIFSALLVGVLETMSTADRSSLSVASIFLAVGFRLAPIALRMQQNVFQIKSNLGTANTTLHLIRDLRNSGEKMNLIKSEHSLQIDSSLRVVAQDLTVLNSNSIVALDKIDLEIKAGEKIVIVGPTGSGKTTLVECILGLIPPSQGRILISGLPPSVYIKRNPGLVGYIPQSIFLKSGTVRDNLALGFDSKYFSDSDYWESLQLAKIDILVDSLPLKLDTNLGEFGGNLSGGERQRLAIARALMTKPKLLIIDEGTSSLDLVTEHEISQEILDFGSDITVIMVAHRTRAMQGFNKIIFLKNGRISDTGSFSDLLARNREFAEMIANNP
jgi:ATP-binding cassette subfamily C protein